LTRSIRDRFIFTLGTNVSRGLISLVTGILLARLLGPELFGDMAFLLGSFMGVLKLLDMGSSSAFFTLMSQKPRSKFFVRSFFTWLAIQFLIPLCLIGLVFPAHWIEIIWNGQPTGLILLAFIAIFMQGPVWGVVQQASESQRRTHLVQGLSVIVVSLHLIAVVLLWMMGWLGLYAIFFAIAVEYLAVAFIAHKRYSYESVVGSRDKLETPAFRSYLNYCLPLIPYSWLGFAYIFIDRWLLQKYSGNVEQAYYGVAAQLATVSLVVTTSILRIFWKEIAEAHKQGDNERLRELYQKASRWLFLFGSVIVGFMMPLSEQILTVLVGESYVGGATTLSIMFIYPVYQSVGQIGGTMFYASEKVSVQSKIGITFLLLSMVMSYFVLGPTDGEIAAFNLGSEGLALKMVIMAFLQVNVVAYAISRIWDWPFDWLYQFVGLLGCIGVGWLSNVVIVGMIADKVPLFVSIPVYGVLYLSLITICVYLMPWLVLMKREKFVFYFMTCFRILRKYQLNFFASINK